MHLLSLIVYNTAIYCYGLGIFIASFFNSQAALWVNGRKYWRCRLMEIDFGRGRRVWFHCASLGEFEQARPVIEKWRAENPSDIIILTFFSPSGYEIRKNYPQADFVLYLPLDTPRSVNHFIKYVKPDIALFVKYEFWYNFITALHKNNIPVILFSAVFRSNQVFFKWYGGLFRNMLRKYSSVLVQNSQSAQLLQQVGVASTVVPDTRFDRVYQIAQAHKQFEAIDIFKTGHNILIAGSTWQRDEELLIQLINENTLSGFKYIIAPHNINQARIAELINLLKVKTIRFSELDNDNAATATVVIVDNIGNLSSLYAYAGLAYIGGGFNTSVHNVLEAAVYNIPVVFGPNYHKAEEAKELLQLGVAFSINNYTGFNEKIRYAVSHLITDYNIKLKLKGYFESKRGGTIQVYQTAISLLR